ncbi:hypothetical protein GPA10_29830 [Streptomyces sp. p1417]|uniref:Uncharacterized protein n=1 Tax=Streptomyces typhae TaxID=2681492 RepID=A0A6L6X514_9ACTN|nr:hypothetical protein [Streptomyces typhae]
MTVPARLHPDPPSPDGPPRRPCSCSDDETTRLLCAGTYLSTRFRRRVVQLLVRHDERTLAPAAGVDVLAVLANARRADRLERTTGVWVAVLWALFALADLLPPHAPFICHAKNGAGREGGDSSWDFPSVVASVFGVPYDLIDIVGDSPKCGMDNGFWVINYTLVCLLLWLAGSISRRSKSAYKPSGLASAQRGGFLPAVVASGVLVSYWATAFVAVLRNPVHWVAVVFPLLLAAPVWVHRRTVERTMRDQFRSGVLGQRPPERLTGPAWLRAVGEVIKKEQDSKIVLYDVGRGFAGLGRVVLDPTPLVMDLKRKPDAGSEALTTADVLGCLRDELGEFREGAGPRSKVDRLKEIRVDELVYLPAELPRDSVDHGQAAVEGHLREAVEEGGEARRHYLRARIGAWEQQVVVTALVRVYTQGKSLTLELCLYVMDPLQPEFKLVDAIAERSPDLPASSMARALLAAPAAGVTAVLSLVGSAGDATLSVKRRFERRNGWDTPSEGASSSVRELAAVWEKSPILDTDVNRYLQALVERIGTGAVRAMREKGYDTTQLEQQVAQVNNQGIFIGTMNGGAVAEGQGARARTVGGIRQRRAGVRRRQRV